MNNLNLYIRGDASNTYLEARDSAILNAGFANFVREYELLHGYQKSDEQKSDEAKSRSETEEEISLDNCSNQSSSLKSFSIKSDENVEVNDSKSRRSESEEEIFLEVCSSQTSSLKSSSIKSEENIEVNESKSRRSEEEEEIFLEVCSSQSSSLKSVSMNSEEEAEDCAPSSSATSASSFESPPKGTFSFFLKMVTKEVSEDAKRCWERMPESERALFVHKEDSVSSFNDGSEPCVNGYQPVNVDQSLSGYQPMIGFQPLNGYQPMNLDQPPNGYQPVNGADPVTPASSDNIFGRGTSSRACAKNVRRRYCKPKCPKPRLCRKRKAAQRCQKPRAPKKCVKRQAAKRCPKPKRSRSKCAHREENI